MCLPMRCLIIAGAKIQFISCFSKVHIMPLPFTKDLHLVPVFPNRNPRRVFAFTKKKAESKNSIQHSSCSKLLKSLPAPQWYPPNTLPKNYSQHQGAIALNYVWELLCFTSFILCVPWQDVS